MSPKDFSFARLCCRKIWFQLVSTSPLRLVLEKEGHNRFGQSQLYGSETQEIAERCVVAVWQLLEGRWNRWNPSSKNARCSWNFWCFPLPANHCNISKHCANRHAEHPEWQINLLFLKLKAASLPRRIIYAHGASWCHCVTAAVHSLGVETPHVDLAIAGTSPSLAGRISHRCVTCIYLHHAGSRQNQKRVTLGWDERHTRQLSRSKKELTREEHVWPLTSSCIRLVSL